jgi:stress response protein YsnF
MPDRTIPVVEEQAEIGTRRRQTGTVRVEKTVRTKDIPVAADLMTETIDIRRVPMDRIVDGPVPDRRDGDTLIVSVLAEVVVVEKRLKVVEEIHLTRHRTTTKLRDTVPVRADEVRVEHTKE